MVELLGRAHEPQRALLNEVQERETLVAVALRDRDDEAKVGLDHLLLGVEVPALDPLGETDLFLGGEQPQLADVLQEQLKRIGGHVRPQVLRSLRLATATLVRVSLELPRRHPRVELLDELDLGALQEAVEVLDVGLVELQLADRLGDLRVREDTEPAAAIREPPDLIKLLKIRY